MKNQYFGDVNDYLKYGILRGLAQSDTRTLVAWLLTADDGRGDGKFLGYLRRPEEWRDFDPALFDFLHSQRPEAGGRSVAAIEGWPGLSATFVSTIVPDDRMGRDEWSRQLYSDALDHELVFFDPDNGIEVKSRPKGRKDSSKYVLWDELALAWDGGASLLVYHHFPLRAASPSLAPKDVGAPLV